MDECIDLHLHSNASDGSMSPTDLVKAATALNITTLALTDHDTTAGLVEASLEAVRSHVEFIPGCELGAQTEYGQVDVLGFWVPSDNKAFEARLLELRTARNRRNLQILAKLAEMGMPIALEELEAMTASTIGRPHIALMMLRKGYITHAREAFEKYIGAKGPAYVRHEPFSPQEAVELLSKTGATPVLAHPMLVRAPFAWLEKLIKDLIPHGLAGLEAYHSEFDHDAIRKTLDLASKYNLVLSGGSDYHGEIKPSIKIGSGKGNLHVPENIPDMLKKLRLKQGLSV